MARYIGADEAIRVLEQLVDALNQQIDFQKTLSTGINIVDLTRRNTYKDAIVAIQEIPTADVREVVHGHWIEKQFYPEYREYKCSVCGKGFVSMVTPYCYMCGADMRGDK